MVNLLDEAARMPDAAVRFARDTEWARVPDEFTSLRDPVESRHGTELAELCEVLYRRFGQPSASWMPIFRAAAIMALMAEVADTDITASQRQRLRGLWDVLLSQ